MNEVMLIGKWLITSEISRCTLKYLRGSIVPKYALLHLIFLFI